jgi:hypothetical protein
MSEYDSDAPPILTPPKATKTPPTIVLTAEQFFTLTDGCSAALDAGIVSDDLADRLYHVSAELRAKGFSRVIPFPRQECRS